MDDGRLTDGQGRTVDFKNTLVLMTSNLPPENLKTHFRPEFLNRLDGTITFHALTQEHLRKIVKLQVGRLAIQKEIETAIGKLILKGEIRDGQTVRVDYDSAKDSLTFTPIDLGMKHSVLSR